MGLNVTEADVVNRRTYASGREREARADVCEEGAFGGQVIARNGASVF